MVGDKRVVLIEDKPQIRDGLAALIDSADGFQCIGTFDSIEVASAEINAKNTDLVLVDIASRGISGIDAIHCFKKKYPDVPLLVLSVYEDDDRIFEALCAGASGYLLKKSSPPQLLEGLKEASNGGARMSPEIAERVIAFFRHNRTTENGDYQLTPHEAKILKLLSEGHNYKTAAAELGHVVNLISNDVKRIYQKLQLLANVKSIQ